MGLSGNERGMILRMNNTSLGMRLGLSGNELGMMGMRFEIKDIKK